MLGHRAFDVFSVLVTAVFLAIVAWGITAAPTDCGGTCSGLMRAIDGLSREILACD